MRLLIQASRRFRARTQLVKGFAWLGACQIGGAVFEACWSCWSREGHGRMKMESSLPDIVRLSILSKFHFRTTPMRTVSLSATSSMPSRHDGKSTVSHTIISYHSLILQRLKDWTLLRRSLNVGSEFSVSKLENKGMSQDGPLRLQVPARLSSFYYEDIEDNQEGKAGNFEAKNRW